MVDITPEEVMRQRQAGLRVGLNKIDRLVVGGPCRLTVPLEDAISMRLVGDRLAALAVSLQALSRRGDLAERELLTLSRQAIRACDREIDLAVYGERHRK